MAFDPETDLVEFDPETDLEEISSDESPPPATIPRKSGKTQLSELPGMFVKNAIRGPQAFQELLPEAMQPHPIDAAREGFESAKGLTGGWLDIAKENSPLARTALGAFPSLERGIETLGEEVIDPISGIIGGGALGASEFFKTTSIPLGLSKVSDELHERGFPEVEAPDTESVTMNALGKTVEGLVNQPAETMAMAAAPMIGKSIKSFKTSRTPPSPATPKSVELFRTVVNPTTGTKFSRNFPESGGNGLRQIVEEAPKTSDPVQNARIGGKAAEKRLGTQREEMTQYGEQRGGQVDLGVAADAVSRIGKNEFFDLVDTDGAKVFDALASKIVPEKVALRSGAEIYSMIEKQLRQMRKAAGDRAAQLEANEKFQAWDTVRKNIGKQLNEQASRRPNEWIENSRDFSDVYNTMEGIERAVEIFSKDPKNVSVWRDYLTAGGIKDKAMKLGFGRNMLTDLQQALNMARSKPLSPSAPMGPQKPSALPNIPRPVNQPSASGVTVPPALMQQFMEQQALPPALRNVNINAMANEPVTGTTSVMGGEAYRPELLPWEPTRHKIPEPIPEPVVTPPESFSTPGGMVTEAAPVRSLPTWVDDVVKAREPEINLKDVKLLRDVVSGKKLYTTTIKAEGTRAWTKNVLKRLEVAPERAAEIIDAIEQRLRSKTQFPKSSSSVSGLPNNIKTTEGLGKSQADAPQAETSLEVAKPKSQETSNPKGTSERLSSFMDKAIQRMEDEAKGQQVLDFLEDSGRTPISVVEDFWGKTYPNLPPEVQARFNNYIRRLTGMKPGDNVAYDTIAKREIVAKDWNDVFPADQVSSEVRYLQGEERGLIALMEVANKRFSSKTLE